MILYLTSDPGGIGIDNNHPVFRPLKKENHMLKKLRKDLRSTCPEKRDHRCLIIAADPLSSDLNDIYKKLLDEAFRKARIPMSKTDICDNRHPEYCNALSDYCLIFILGGHAPTQNAFINSLNLRDKIRNYCGIVMSLSAGSMNCADIVYLLPEYEADCDTPSELRFVQGLALTDIQIIPHFQWLKDQKLRGQSIIEQFAIPDSVGNNFIGLCDGSYFYIKDNSTTLFGEAYKITKDGILRI